MSLILIILVLVSANETCHWYNFQRVLLLLLSLRAHVVYVLEVLLTKIYASVT